MVWLVNVKWVVDVWEGVFCVCVVWWIGWRVYSWGGKLNCCCVGLLWCDFFDEFVLWENYIWLNC